MSLFVLLGLIATLAACSCIYLASPHQRWLSLAWPALPARLGGGMLLVCGLLLLMQTMQTLTAVFAWATAMMLGFALLPYIGALRSLGRKA